MKTNPDPPVNCLRSVPVAWFGLPDLRYFTLRNPLISSQCTRLHVNEEFFTNLASAKTSRHHLFLILPAVMHIILQLRAANVNAKNRLKLFICQCLRNWSFPELKINCADKSSVRAAAMYSAPFFRHSAFCLLHFQKSPAISHLSRNFLRQHFAKSFLWAPSCHLALPNLRSAFRSLPVI